MRALVVNKVSTLYKRGNWSFYMLGTIVAVVAALFFAYSGYQLPEAKPFFIVISLLFLALAYLGRAFAYKTVLKTQNKVMSGALMLFQKDWMLSSSIYYFFFFTILSFFLPLPIWLVAFGIGFDLLRYSLERSFRYADVLFLTKGLSKYMQGDESQSYEMFEIAIDTAAKAAKKGQIWLANAALESIQSLIEAYVQDAAKREMRQVSAVNGLRLSFLDKVNSLAIFISERLSWLYNIVQEEKCQPIAESIISEYGKMSVFFARHNTKVAAIPIAFLYTCAEKSKHPDSLIRISLTLSETVKRLIAYTKERNESMQTLVLTALNTLEQVVKMLYKQNRDVNVVLLMQPFAEIAEFVGQDDMRSFPDRDDVLREIKRVLTEFQALQMVSKKVEMAEDSTSSYKQDMPYMP